jgi:transcriptional antiterminator
MPENWRTIPEAAVMLGISERTLRRRISEGNYETKLDGNRKLVLLADNMTDDNLLAEKDKLIETLTKQVEHLQALLDETNSARERSDRCSRSNGEKNNDPFLSQFSGLDKMMKCSS